MSLQVHEARNNNTKRHCTLPLLLFLALWYIVVRCGSVAVKVDINRDIYSDLMTWLYDGSLARGKASPATFENCTPVTQNCVSYVAYVP